MNMVKLIGYKVFNGYKLEEYIDFLQSNGFKVKNQEKYTVFRTLLYTESEKVLSKK